MPKNQNNQQKQAQFAANPNVPQFVPVPEYMNTSQAEVPRPPPGLEMFSTPPTNAHYGLFNPDIQQPGLGVFQPQAVPHVVPPFKAGRATKKQPNADAANMNDLKYLLEQLSVEQEMAMGA
jgi:hypothetical protein